MLADCGIKVQCHLAAQTVEEDHFLQTFFSSGWQVEDKWKVKMARGGMLVSRNGYRGTLPCRALWDMSSTEVAAQMTYYSSAGNAWAYRRRRFSCVLQTFHFGCLPAAFTQVQREPHEGPRRVCVGPFREGCEPGGLFNAPTFNFEVFFDWAVKILANTAEALFISVNQLEPSRDQMAAL